MTLGQTNFTQGARKTETVQQSEGEGDEPRCLRSDAFAPLPSVHNLCGDEHDRECDDSLDRRLRHMYEAKAAKPRVMEWATVKAVTVFTSLQSPWVMMSIARINNR